MHKSKYKRGMKVTLFLSCAGIVTKETGIVGSVTKKGVFLDNGSGNDPSGPFHPDTGKDDGSGMFGRMWIKPLLEKEEGK